MRIVSIVVVVLLTGWLLHGFMSEPVPGRVDGYLAYCSGHTSACEDEVALTSAAVVGEYMPGTQYCPPGKPDRVSEERGVRAWLAAHPEMRDAPTSVGIRNALFAITACRRR